MSVPPPRTTPDDPVGAFVPGPRLRLEPTGSGLLDGLSCGVKDVFDIAGAITGCGNPTFAQTHALAAATAAAVERVLAQGAHMVGKTITDELAFSINGANHHYGAPLNTAAPDRLAGGSSCGSAAAVAAGLCDFALGTDTGGSVRAPGSFCGLFGFRPTHGAVSAAGVRPLAPSFDAVGWFTRSGDLLERVGAALLPEDTRILDVAQRHWPADAWDLLEPTLLPDFRAEIENALPPAIRFSQEPLSSSGLGAWFEAFRTLQFAEVWAVFGGWLASARPVLGPGIAERMEAASRVTAQQVAAAGAVRAAVREMLDSAGLIILPTMPGAAPLRTASVATLEGYRGHAMRLLCIAGLAGCPQVTLPLLSASGAPLGLSLVAAPGTDRQLLRIAARLARALPARRRQGQEGVIGAEEALSCDLAAR